MTDAVREKLEELDVSVLNDHNVSDETMMVLAVEHSARTEALCKLIDPTRARAILLMIAGHLLKVSKEIDNVTYQEPELLHV